MSKRQVVLLIYKYFLRKLGEDYKSNHKDRDVITSLLLSLHLTYNLKLIGNRFLFNFIANQFEYRSSSRSFSKYSVLNIFGKPSIKRYIEDKRRVEFKFIDDKFLRDNKIVFSEIFRERGKYVKLDSSLDKKRFHNTDAGFLFCLETTTLYDRSSIECMTCNYSKQCRELKEEKNVRRASV